MERNQSRGDDRIVYEDVLAGAEEVVESPTEAAAERFQQAVEGRDAQELRQLVHDEYPKVLWTDVFGQLSPDHRRWVVSVLTGGHPRD